MTIERTAMPATVVAGDGLILNRADLQTAYPSGSGWTLQLVIAPASGGASTNFAGVADAQGWKFTLSSAATTQMAAGSFTYAIQGSLGGERTTIENGFVRILADPVGNADKRSPSRRCLDAIDAMLEGRASEAEKRFRFEDGREVEYIPLDELLRLRKFYARAVEIEERGRGGPSRILTRM